MTKISEELLSYPIDSLELSVRCNNCLRAAGYTTVGELVTVFENDNGNALLSLPHFGRKSFHEIKEAVGSLVNYRSAELLRWINAHNEELTAVMDGWAVIVPTYRFFVHAVQGDFK